MRLMPRFPELLSDDLTPQQAEQLQGDFKDKIVLKAMKIPATVTGVDIAYQTTGSTGAVAVAVTVAIPSLKMLETAQVAGSCNFPYMPGLLGFRELNLISRALFKLDQPVEVILYDGHGIAHPRRFGAASQLGIALGIPTIGCAKQLMHGHVDGILSHEKFASRPVVAGGDQLETIGIAIRTVSGIKPIFISPGYLVDIPSAMEIIKASTSEYRIPEPIRLADQIARKHVRFFDE